MSIELKLEELFSKLKSICKDQSIEILDNGTEEYDCFISFKFIKDNNFFYKLFLLREMEYVFHFEKHNILTISGKQDLYEDILKVLENTNIVSYSDIEEIISFMEKVDDNSLNIISYFNGVTYNYEIDDNIYNHAFKYYDFIFDGYRYHYRVNNFEIFSKVMKEINKNLDVYKRLMKDTDIVLEGEVTGKNTYIQEIREEYSKKGNKELFIIFRDSNYYVILKVGTNMFMYKYDSNRYIKNMIPELLQLYLENSKGVYKEESHSCLGRSFYMNVVDANNKLFLYNIDEIELSSYISYLQVLSKNIANKLGHNLVKDKVISYDDRRDSYGFVNILVLSVGVLIFSVFVFLVTLSFLK